MAKTNNKSSNGKSKDMRLGALYRFGMAITVFNILGHTVFGFEQSIAQPLTALATGYLLELGVEWLLARSQKRPPRFAGGMRCLIEFLLPIHIGSLAVAMLLYANDRLWPVAFAVSVLVASKTLLRIPMGKGTRHFLNPSNAGIATTLLVFPWVGIAPPYHFVENLYGVGDWILPGIIIISGTFLNWKFTRKLPLIGAWVSGFVIQAVIRSTIQGTPVAATLLPMTGVAFVLFTFYMVSDPATTPWSPRHQVLFGFSVAFVYGLLMALHVVFTLFFSLVIVCTVRGLACYILAKRELAQETQPTPAPVTAGAPFRGLKR